MQLASHYAEVLGARLTPVLTAVREEAVGGQYALVLEFQVRRTCMLRTQPYGMSCLGLLCRANGMPAASAAIKEASGSLACS